MKIKIKSFLITIIIIILHILICGCIENVTNVEKSITIKGKDGIYFTIMDAINESSEGDTILVSEGIYNETLTINKSIKLIGENKDTTIISGNKTGDVIYVTVDYVNISGFTIKNSGNMFSQVVDAGIEINSHNNKIYDNNIISNGNYGLYLYNKSKNNNIINNKISKNRYGIYFNNAYENNISSNAFSLNTDYGVYLGSQSNKNRIYDNVFSENQYGVRIKGSESNWITQNLFVNNKFGLYLCCGARNNIAFINSFENNSKWNAKDTSINQWEYGELGNYWDDYNGTDMDGNGIGDTPYDIPLGNNQDKYPLMISYKFYIDR